MALAQFGADFFFSSIFGFPLCIFRPNFNDFALCFSLGPRNKINTKIRQNIILQ